MINSSELDALLSFVKEKLPSRKRMLSMSKLGPTWDARAKKLIFNATIQIIMERYGKSKNEARRYIRVEGLNPLFTERKGKLFDSYLSPDATLEFDDGQSAAIELDHGSQGSTVKNALARAGILKLATNYTKVVVFFFADPPLKERKLTETEQKVLNFYQENLSTWLFFI